MSTKKKKINFIKKTLRKNERKDYAFICSLRLLNKFSKSENIINNLASQNSRTMTFNQIKRKLKLNKKKEVIT